MKKILILEDNEEHRKTLITLINGLKKEIQVFSTGRVEEAYGFVLEKDISLFLIDIILNNKKGNDVSGLKFADTIRKIPNYKFTPLIFITSLEDPRLYAYRNIHCYGYIEKPFRPIEVTDLVNQALLFPVHKADTENMYFRVDGIVYAVNSKDIVYLESSRRKVIVNTVNEKITIKNKTMTEVMRELNSKNFVQCSRFFVVNKTYIEYIDYVNRYIKIRECEKAIEIGASMKKRVKNELENDN